MKQPGRKSAAELSVVADHGFTKIPPPPKHLSARAGETWRMIMASRAAEMVEPEAYPVLVEYCRSIEQSDVVAEQVKAFKVAGFSTEEGLRRYDKLIMLQEKLTRAITSTAVKLRLTPSTRFDANTAARVGAKSIEAKKPWE